MLSEKNINGLLAVFFILLFLGFLIHRNQSFPGSFPGHITGLVGTAGILLSLLYPFRKRVLGKKGKQNPLNRHITYGLAGASLAVIHSAHKTASLIGLLIFLSLLLLILSGIVGRFLFRKVNKGLKGLKGDLDLLKKDLKNEGSILSCNVSFGLADISDATEVGMDDKSALSATNDRYRQWVDKTFAMADLEYSVRIFDKTKRLFSWWLRAHYLFTFFLLAMLAVHILTTIYFGITWLP